MFSLNQNSDNQDNESSSDGKDAPLSVWRKRFHRATVWSLVSYLVSLVLLVPILQIAGDRYWWATILLYTPRIVYGVPFLLLIPAILYFGMRRSYFIMLLVAFLIWMGPVMGFNVPWRTLFVKSSPERIRILTCNICGEAGDRQILKSIIELTHVNLVALQEYDPKSTEVTWPEKWHSVRHGKLAIGSQWPILSTQVHRRVFPPSRWPQVNAIYCVLDTPSGAIGFAAIHLRTPREGLLTVLDRKTIIAPSRRKELINDIQMRRKESAEVRQWLDQFPEPKLIAGDFNMPDDSSIFRRDWASYKSAFQYAGTGVGMTKQTETPFFGGTFGTRIDHILVDKAFTPRLLLGRPTYRVRPPPALG